MNAQTLKSDFTASLVVFLVALPLSLGIALASGAPAKAAILAAILGGIVVGALSGAPLQVSGPAAGLSVMVFGFIQNFGFEKTCIVASIAGFLQILFGVLRAAKVATLIPAAVIHGMLGGIGVLIAMGQLHVVLGAKPYSSGIQNLLSYPENFASLNVYTVILGLSTIAVIVLWAKRLRRLASVIPGSLVAVVLLTAVAAFAAWDVPRVALDADALSFQFGWVKPESGEWMALIIAGVTLFLVASAESLLCAIATDKLHPGAPANLNRELMAQGVGNFLSGSLSGLPITGVIVRSAANISSGAKTRVSAILHGVWVLIFVLLGRDLITMIPLSVLAGLLIHVGVNLVKIEHIRHLRHEGQHWVYFATLFGVVFVNLLAGIGIGLGLHFVMRLLQKKQSHA